MFFEFNKLLLTQKSQKDVIYKYQFTLSKRSIWTEDFIYQYRIPI